MLKLGLHLCYGKAINNHQHFQLINKSFEYGNSVYAIMCKTAISKPREHKTSP